MMTEQIDPRVYPIGKHTKPDAISVDMRHEYIDRLSKLPQKLKTLASQISEKQLQSSYRENGWTARQIFNHIADSHCNMYLRIKLALTSNNPTIIPYDENQWAEFYDGKLGDIHISIAMIEAMHTKLVSTLRTLPDAEFAKTYVHPQYMTTSTIDQVLASYAWHGDHHAAQIQVIMNS
jgi:uncharacterized damage-inducible protein DinB